MATFVNTHALSETSFSSSALGVLGTITHPLPSEGRFTLSVHQGNIIVGIVVLVVSAGADADQVTLDLAAFGPSSLGRKQRSEHVIRPGGYLVLYVSQGGARYHVLLAMHPTERIDDSDRAREHAVEFDSRLLQLEDLYALTLLRPGAYDVLNVETGATGEITVLYPEVGRIPYTPQDPVTIECTKGDFTPATIMIGPGQGTIFRPLVSSAVTVRLRTPDDGPASNEPMFRGLSNRPKQSEERKSREQPTVVKRRRPGKSKRTE